MKQKKLRVLIIEDNVDMAENISDFLEAQGHIIDYAIDGISGFRLALTEPFDAIILDLMLPGMDGFEICHRLRSEKNTAQLPILMFSAKAQEIDKDTGLKVGADDYLPKPATPAEIIGRVEALLAKKKRAAPSEEKVSG